MDSDLAVLKPFAMDSSKIENRFTELVQLLHHYNTQYYVFDTPEISDAEYDRLFKELQKIEKDHPKLKTLDSPTQRVGAPPREGFTKVEHRIPMLSLANAFDEVELNEFDDRMHKLLGRKMEDSIQYFVELKFDGLSLNLTYENGILVRAATRGDGQVGEEVTQNVRTIRSVPLRLAGKPIPSLIEIRGEAIFPIKEFKKLNIENGKKGERIFSNPRNAASGTLRQLDSRITASRPLSAFWYGMGEVQGMSFNSIYEFQKQLSKWGLLVGQYKKVCKGPKEVMKFYKDIESQREKLPFEIDGIVVKLNLVKEIEKAGYISRSPRGMLAFKYAPTQDTTVIEDIIVQVGRTGAITPVACVEPVDLGGAVVRRATLHNQDEIDRKDIRIGDRVVIQRAGDVIPEVVSVVKSVRTGKEKKFSIPDECPSCGKKVSKSIGEAVARCINRSCEAQVKERLRHFVSKAAMNVDGLGVKIIVQLVDKKMVKSPSDLFKLKKADALKLEGFKEKSADNLINALDAVRKPDLHRLIFALGIRNVGERAGKLLAAEFGSLEKLSKASQDQLESIHEIGPEVARSIEEFFKDAECKNDVEKLLKEVTPIFRANPRGGGILNGKVFVITGTLPSLGRAEAAELIESHGGKASSSVSKKTNYLLAGEKAGSKLDKAKKIGVAVIDEDGFRRLIAGDQI